MISYPTSVSRLGVPPPEARREAEGGSRRPSLGVIRWQTIVHLEIVVVRAEKPLE